MIRWHDDPEPTVLDRLIVACEQTICRHKDVSYERSEHLRLKVKCVKCGWVSPGVSLDAPGR